MSSRDGFSAPHPWLPPSGLKRIGANCAADAPPKLSVEGGTLEGHVPERRASRIAVTGKVVTILFDAGEGWVNPVLELPGAKTRLHRLRAGDEEVDEQKYTWDALVLWINHTFDGSGFLRLEFRD